MLTTHQSISVSTSSVAPVYSAVVTVPLIVALIGPGAPLAYLLALIPVALVWAGMSANDARDPDKGSVYSWAVRTHPRAGWVAGYALGLTGVIATAGLGYVALEALWPNAQAWIKALAGVVLIAAATGASTSSVKLTSAVQSAGVILQVLTAGYLLWVLAQAGFAAAAPTGTATDWIHAVLLAVFAFWGFDAVYALSPESERGVPARAAGASLGLLLVIFLAFCLLGISSDPRAVAALAHPVVVAGVVISCVMALGSTLIPTARGISAMAQRGHAPAWLSDPDRAAWSSAAAAAAWLGLTLVVPGVFEDTVEMLSVFVGLYFTISCATAALHARGASRALHSLATALMGAITVCALVTMFAPDYGATSVAGIGGVGLLAAGFTALGVALAFAVTRRGAQPAH